MDVGLATLIFLIIGGFSVLFLLVALLGSEVHLGHSDFGGWFSLPALAGFTGAFGFGGAIAAELTPGQGMDGLIGAVAGVAVAIPVGWLAGRLVRAAKDMKTDSTLTTGHLIGSTGTVLTPLAHGRYGEVRLEIGGQVMRLNARSDQPLPRGASILVIDTVSPTCVQVEPTPQYFSKEGQ